MEILIMIMFFLASRLNSMVFKSNTKSIHIKNNIIAKIFIARKNTWGIQTSVKLQNRMSMLGLFSYILAIIMGYLFTQQGKDEDLIIVAYLYVVILFYAISVCVKIVEAKNYKNCK